MNAAVTMQQLHPHCMRHWSPTDLRVGVVELEPIAASCCDDVQVQHQRHLTNERMSSGIQKVGSVSWVGLQW